MRARRSAPPVWFSLLVAVAVAVVLRTLAGVRWDGAAAGGDGHQVQLAFWPLVTLIASAIWKGLEVAGRITLTALTWSVKALWWFATTTFNALKAVGITLQKGLKETWQFFRATYDHVLKPAWEKLRTWYRDFRNWYDATIKPVLDFAIAVRDTVVCWWKTYVRPWLDLIDITRRVARVLGALGFEWAKTLDAKLGALEEKIERPFRALLAKVNDVVNIINRVITFDGLFQRLALIRSIERDMRFAWRAAVNWRSEAVTDDTYKGIRANDHTRTLAKARQDLESAVTSGEGYHRAMIDEMSVQWRLYLEGRG